MDKLNELLFEFGRFLAKHPMKASFLLGLVIGFLLGFML